MNDELIKFDVINSEASTSDVSDDRMVSVFPLSVCVCDVASPIPSWHRLWLGGACQVCGKSRLAYLTTLGIETACKSGKV